MSQSAITTSVHAITLRIGYISDTMARWEPDARGRLENAAMELFVERGYARTTVGDIAERAGLTERTFFRYFSDKREVLFSGSKELENSIVDAVKSAPADAAPLEVVACAMEAAGAALQAHRELSYVRARFAIVVEHAEVRERELIKMASLATAVREALRSRGVAEPAASLIAEVGITVFKLAFERWVSSGKGKPLSLAQHIRATVDTLQNISAGGISARQSKRTAKPGAAGPGRSHAHGPKS
jgi:AcrR family transcriptional regulator